MVFSSNRRQASLADSSAAVSQPRNTVAFSPACPAVAFISSSASRTTALRSLASLALACSVVILFLFFELLPLATLSSKTRKAQWENDAGSKPGQGQSRKALASAPVSLMGTSETGVCWSECRRFKPARMPALRAVGDPARPVAGWQAARDSLQRQGNRNDKATFSP